MSSIALAAHETSEEVACKITQWRAEMDVFLDASIILLDPKWKPRDCVLSRTLKSHFWDENLLFLGSGSKAKEKKGNKNDLK